MAKRTPAPSEETTTAPATATAGGLHVKPKVSAASDDIPLSQINIGLNPRKDLGDTSGLEKSIKSPIGLIHPLIVRPSTKKAGTYDLVSGGRRHKAVTNLGWVTAPCIIRDIPDDNDAIAFAVAENSEEGRSSLSILDLGSAAAVVMKATGETIEKVAGKFQVNTQQVRRAVKLLDAPPALRKAVSEGKVPYTVALEVLNVNEDHRNKVQKQVMDNPDMTVDAVRAAAKSLAKDATKGNTDDNKDSGKDKKKGKKKGVARDAALAVWRGKRELGEALAIICNAIHTAINTKDTENAEFGMLVGASQALLWARSDIETLDGLKSYTDMSAAEKKAYLAVLAEEAEKAPATDDPATPETPAGETPEGGASEN